MNATKAMTLPLFEHLSEVAEPIAAARRVFLFLDFDGTLAPIVNDPSAAVMPQATSQALAAVARSSRFEIAIVSGRSISDLEKRVGLPDIIYAGDFGFAIRGPGLSFVEPAAAARTEVMDKLVRLLESRLLPIPGALVENKGLTASIHFRAARESDRQQIYQIAAKTVAASGDLFRLFQGLSALDIRPWVHWNKGTAAQWILATTGNPFALPIYVGDDVSDEDAFSALQSGITVRVGRTGDTAAQYRLDDPAEVGRFLIWLSELDSNHSPLIASPRGS
jgi:trehalose 6-phosphate phosphatase